MRCCKKILDSLCKPALLLSLYICASVANAEGIAVTKAETRSVEEGYEIWADFKITLPPSVAEALRRGVALNFTSELTVTRSRWYWLDTAVAQNEQTTKLFYNALTRQYRISRGTLFQGFSNLESALRVLGHQSAPPIPEAALDSWGGYVAKLLNSQTKYTAFAQMRLDTSQLPKPLQVNALTNSEWNLESERYSWPVHPGLPETGEARKP